MVEKMKDKLIVFVRSYISFVVAILICIVYVAIDLIVFNVNTNPQVVISKVLIYLVISTTINALLRRQGLIYGNLDHDFLLVKQDYDNIINESDTTDLDEFCEFKNEQRRIQLCKKKLRWCKLSFEKYENGDYEIITEEEEKNYSPRQLKAIRYCNKLDVKLYDSDYLIADYENEKNNKVVKVSQTKYANSKNVQSLIMGFVTSIAFAYLGVSLANDISWANVFYSLIKVITWLGSGVVSMVGAYSFVTITYKDVIKDKSLKMKEYKLWFEKKHQNETKEEQKVEKPINSNESMDSLGVATDKGVH